MVWSARMSSTPLWAPWRMQYILAPKAAGCFLCDHPKDPARRRENLVLAVRPHAFVCLNRFPFTPCHLLVSPLRHVADPALLEADEWAALMDLLRASLECLRNATKCEGVNVGFNLGKVAGGSVAEHLHGHVVPRWTGDSNFMPVIADTRVMPEHLDDAWARIAPSFAELDESA